jgi:hypothetical protein
MKTFHNKTFVAFIDISGFKKMMGKGKRVSQVLNTFYKAGYDELRRKDTPLSGVFVSDCGILYVHDEHINDTKKLQNLLEVVWKINVTMLEKDVMLKTSIAFGQFDYEERLQLENISKDKICGRAYFDAYAINDKVDTGKCLILSEGLEESTITDFKMTFPLLKGKENGYLYYWNLQIKEKIEDMNYSGYCNLQIEEKIEDFEEEYQDAKKKRANAKYKEILRVLKKYRNIDQ